MKCPKCKTDNPEASRFCADCGTQLIPDEKEPVIHTETLQAPKEELTTGSTFADRYQIIEELGKGGMGKVYKAQDTEIKEKVALKLIKPEIAADKKTIERFQNELKLSRKISHRNVCRMFDLNKEDGSYYITMEFVDGEDLKSMIRMSGQLSIGTAIRISKQVCEGLAEAHSLGVIHRDLKPSNIMIDKSGNAKIMDFGIARSLKAKGITGAGVMIGTPEYMSPEQVEGKEVDQRTDIYSMGVILYEMVTGRVPCEGETALTVAVRHKSEEPADPKQHNPHISDDLSRVILKCLEKGKEARFQSAGELRSALTNIEEGIPTTEHVIPERTPLTSREITVKFSMKKAFVPVLVFIAVIVIGIVIWRLVPSKETVAIPTDKPSLAVLYFENNTGDENLDHWRKMFADLLITDLGQSKHLSVLPGDRLYKILSQLDQLEAKTYSSDVLKEVANQGGVKYVLVGKYAKMGDTFRIDCMLQDAGTGELVNTLRTEAVGEQDVFAKVDTLTSDIKSNFNLSRSQIAEDIDYDVQQITTASPEALKYFSEADKHRDAGREREAIPLLERAVEIDPEFALAYRAMGMAYRNLGFRTEAEKHLQKALELSDRLSERIRYQIQGSRYLANETTYDRAIEAFEKKLNLYPDDQNANHNLGVLYSYIGEWEKAVERYEYLVKTGSEYLYTHANLAGNCENLGLIAKARRILDNYIENIGDSAYVRRASAWNYRIQGKFDLALQEINKALMLEPTHHANLGAFGNIFLHMGEWDKAKLEYEKILKLAEPYNSWGFQRLALLFQIRGKFEDSKELWKKGLALSKKFVEKPWIRGWRGYLAYAESVTGNHAEALELLEKNWQSAVEDEHLGSQRGTLISKGFTYLNMGDLDKAQEMADKHKIMAEQAMNRRYIRNTYHLQARIEIEKGNYTLATDHLKKALPLLAKDSAAWLVMTDALALAYYKSGALEKAREEYERLQSFPFGRDRYGDYYAKSFYMLGMVYQDLGDKAKAIENYEEFLELWKEADPGFPEVEGAQKRLSDLKH